MSMAKHLDLNPWRRVHLNEADELELMKVEGVDIVRARQIIELRHRNGAIGSWDELAELPDFNDETVEQLRRGRATLS
jgi:DNA uptake protein ComE-like DNA-binding protein